MKKIIVNKNYIIFGQATKNGWEKYLNFILKKEKKKNDQKNEPNYISPGNQKLGLLIFYFAKII